MISRWALLPQANSSAGRNPPHTASTPAIVLLLRFHCLWRAVIRDGLGPRCRIQRAAMAAIGKVNHKADDHPHEKANPVFESKTRHQQNASDDRQNWQQRYQGHLKAARSVRLRFAQ